MKDAEHEASEQRATAREKEGECRLMLALRARHATVPAAGLLRRTALTRAPAQVIVRSFIGGPFATDFDAARAKVRRRRIRSFLGTLELLPNAAHEVPRELASTVFAEHASDGVFHSQQQLQKAVQDAQLRLSETLTATPFRLELKSTTETAATDAGVAATPSADAVASTAGTASTECQAPHGHATG